MEQSPVLLTEQAIHAAFAAGREIMQVYAGEIQVDHKDDRSPLTEADRRAHRTIAAHLEATGLPVLSEEGAMVEPTVRRQWERYWLVDPLDGTKEFVKRNGEFTVNIALMQREGSVEDALGVAVPIAGVIYAPVHDVLYFAWSGGGAYRLEHAATLAPGTAYERAAMSTRLPLPNTLTTRTVLASRSHRSAETEAFIREQEGTHGSVALTSKGSAWKFGLMAEGAAHVYPRFAPTMEWDTAAGQVICAEAGLTLTDVTTNATMRYNKYDLVNNWFIVQ